MYLSWKWSQSSNCPVPKEAMMPEPMVEEQHLKPRRHGLVFPFPFSIFHSFTSRSSTSLSLAGLTSLTEVPVSSFFNQLPSLVIATLELTLCVLYLTLN